MPAYPVQRLWDRLRGRGPARSYTRMDNTQFCDVFNKSDMAEYDKRYNSFVSGGWLIPISMKELAFSGFCYMGKGDSAVCFECKVIISDWHCGDQAMNKHRMSSRCCKYLNSILQKVKKIEFDAVSPPTSPNNSEEKPTQTDGKIEFLKSEFNRLMTFQEWPLGKPVDRLAFAATGLYRTNDSDDTVKCFACFVEMKDWKEGDDPKGKHEELSRDCPLIKNQATENKAITAEEKDQALRFFEALSSKPIASPSYTKDPLYQSAIHKEYLKMKGRLETFLSWPDDHCQKPESLARAGFFSTGNGVLVTCFYCGGELGEWEPQDDPMDTHIAKFPDCRWAKFEKCKRRVIKTKKRLSKEANKSNETRDEPITSNEET